ncbi:MAG: anion permease [Bdellovibrionales bacterium]
MIILLSALFLAFSNGANDNFKGVATLLGSKTTTYKIALSWATITTLLGSAVAFFFAQKLIANFSGKGLVPADVVALSSFTASVALASASTVFLATRFGFPISTTHAITGALVGAGLFASASGVNFSQLVSTFFLPLIISPLLAIAGAIAIYPILSRMRKRFKVERESCLCLGNEVLVSAPADVPHGNLAAMISVANFPTISVGTQITCEKRYVGKIWGINAKKVLDLGHFISSGLVSFARGLNDTPKIAALLLAGQHFSGMNATGGVGIVIGIGGLIMSRRIADTMSFQITEMNDGQAFSANLVTSAIVLGASHIGVPVSTTHVSCGSLFGIGAVTKQAHWGSILKIILAWVVTLPIASLLGLLSFLLLRGVI